MAKKINTTALKKVKGGVEENLSFVGDDEEIPGEYLKRMIGRKARPCAYDELLVEVPAVEITEKIKAI